MGESTIATSSLWNPCGQCDNQRIKIIGAKGAYLACDTGQQLFDATSSWWCKLLGHGHPRLIEALNNQLAQFEHVLLGNVHFDVIDELSDRLCALGSNLSKVLYASDGACALEQAMKLSIQARQLTGSSRHVFAALKGDYHGDTLGALSVTDGIFRKGFESHVNHSVFIEVGPYLTGKKDPAWGSYENWSTVEAQLEPLKHELTALVLEPVVQGASGMNIYSPDLLRHLRMWCDHNDVHLIADEIFTGLYRTGTPLAIDHAGIEADFVCLGKGLTSGMLPMSAVCVSHQVVNIFRESRATFWHSHTFAGNALAAAVAVEVLNILDDMDMPKVVSKLEQKLYHMARVYAAEYGGHNVRSLGAIAAFDCSSDHSAQDVKSQLLEQNILVRPLGKTVYFTPPLNTTFSGNGVL